MDIEIFSLLIFITLIFMLSIGLPIAWSMGATAVIFTFIFFDPLTLISFVGRMFSSIMMNYTLLAIPLYVLMAAILQQSGVTEQLFDAVHVWSGKLRGGLAVGTIISCTIMAAMVGVVGAEIITFGLLAVPEMLNRGYDKRLALGSVCAGGGLATLIPPSTTFIVYGMITNTSIGELFIAGIIPGILLALLFISYIVVAALVKPNWAPIASIEERGISFRKKIELLKGLALPSLIAFGVLGSIYAGIATPTEAGALGTVAAIFSAAVNRRLSIKMFLDSLYQTIIVSCFIAWLFFGAQALIGVYTLAGGDDFVRKAITSLPYGRWGAIIGMQIILIILGMFLDWIGILFLTMPLFLPIILDMGFDPVWFGVVFCMNCHIGYLSPPFGPSVFILKSVTPEGITTLDIYKSVMPYMWLTFVALFLTVVFPELSLWLPQRIK
jgi:tripartite ATP-independent transporter DctM subunit